MRPGMSALASGEERYTVRGGGAIAVPIHAGDHVRIVDVEGMQRCEIVAGHIDHQSRIFPRKALPIGFDLSLVSMCLMIGDDYHTRGSGGTKAG